MSTFTELLGTDNEQEQEARIKELLIKEATPDILLHIRYNGIKDAVVVDMDGGDVPFDILHRMLELTSTALRDAEKEVLMAEMLEEAKKAEE